MQHINLDVKNLLAWQPIKPSGRALHYVQDRYAVFPLEVVVDGAPAGGTPDAIGGAVVQVPVQPNGLALYPGQTLDFGEVPQVLYVRLAPEMMVPSGGFAWPSFWGNPPKAAEAYDEQQAKGALNKNNDASTTGVSALSRGLAQDGALLSRVHLVSGELRQMGPAARKQVLLPGLQFPASPAGIGINTATWNGTHWGVTGQTKCQIVHPTALLGNAASKMFRRARLFFTFRYTGAALLTTATQDPHRFDFTESYLPQVAYYVNSYAIGSCSPNSQCWGAFDAGPLERIAGLAVSPGQGLLLGTFEGFNAASRTCQLQAFWVLDQAEPAEVMGPVAYNYIAAAQTVGAGQVHAVWTPGGGLDHEFACYPDAVTAPSYCVEVVTARSGNINAETVTHFSASGTPATVATTNKAVTVAGTAQWILFQANRQMTFGWMMVGNGAGVWTNARVSVRSRTPTRK